MKTMEHPTDNNNKKKKKKKKKQQQQQQQQNADMWVHISLSTSVTTQEAYCIKLDFVLAWGFSGPTNPVIPQRSWTTEPSL